MKGNGFKIFAAVAFLLVSVYYLVPTLQAYRLEQRLDAMSDAERQAYLEDNYDDITATRERALNLGLDLQGGMHVTLEVGVDALLRQLAEGRTDDVFDRALASARSEAQTSRLSFVELFAAAIEAEQPGTRLSRYFRNREAGITARSDNADVVAYLTTEANDALDRAIEIIRKRAWWSSYRGWTSPAACVTCSAERHAWSSGSWRTRWSSRPRRSASSRTWPARPRPTRPTPPATRPRPAPTAPRRRRPTRVPRTTPPRRASRS
jgi:hypothetical protein